MESERPKTLQPNYFRTDKLMNKDDIYEQCSVKSFENEKKLEPGPIYVKLVQHLSSHIDILDLNVLKTKSYKNIVRIVLNSLGSLVYGDLCTLDEDQSTNLCKFLLNLRYFNMRST